MKICPLSITCGVLVCFSSVSFAAMVGSSRPVAQANFQQLIKTNACPSCDLAGVVLTRIDLSEANLENANLAGAQLFLTDLSNANLKGANLQGAKLGGADLGGADLRGANLTGAVLEGAYLQGAQLDGKIVSDTPYVDDDLPEVTEKKYIDQASRGKKAPYTQEAVVADPRLPATSKTIEAIATNKAELQTSAADKASGIASKKVMPMANAVVHGKGVAQAVQEGSIPEANVQEKGFWDSVTSFFDKESVPVEKEIDTIAAPAPKAAQVVSPGQPVVHSKKMVTMGDAVVPTDASPNPPTVAVPVAETEEHKEGGLWSSISSIFSADTEKKQGGNEKPAAVQEVPASTASTGKDALAEDAGVRKMIEQIEGSVPETAEAAPEVKSPTPAKGVLDDIENEIPQAKSEKTVATVQKKAESPLVEASDTAVSVADKMETAGNDIVSAVSAGAATVYDVVTPAQAMAGRQKIIARLLDEERCVGCDLAGADLSGKDLEKADLERVNLQGANLAGIDFEEANLKGALLSGANLRDADLREADLYMADFSGADLTGARFEGALIDSADFSDAIGVNLAGANKEE